MKYEYSKKRDQELIKLEKSEILYRQVIMVDRQSWEIREAITSWMINHENKFDKALEPTPEVEVITLVDLYFEELGESATEFYESLQDFKLYAISKSYKDFSKNEPKKNFEFSARINKHHKEFRANSAQFKLQIREVRKNLVI